MVGFIKIKNYSVNKYISYTINIVVIIFILLSIFITPEPLKKNNVENLSNRLKDISFLDLSPDINHGYTMLSKLIPKVSDSLNGLYSHTIKDQIISEIEKLDALIEKSIDKSDIKRKKFLKNLKKPILTIKDSLVGYQLQNIEYMKERFHKGVEKALKEIPKRENLIEKLYNEIPQSIHFLLCSIGIKLFFSVIFIVVAFQLAITIVDNDYPNIKYLYLTFCIVYFIISIQLNHRSAILFQFSSGMLPLFYFRFKNNKKILGILAVITALLLNFYKLDLFEKWYDSLTYKEDLTKATVCPIVSFQLLKFHNDKFYVPEFTSNLLKDLTSPLYIHSEIGSYIYKTTRSSLYTIMLLKEEIKNSCDINFSPMNPFASNILGTDYRLTHGIWAYQVKISDINLENLSSDLKISLERLNPDGTIIFLDSENYDDKANQEDMVIIEDILISIVSSFSYSEYFRYPQDLNTFFGIKPSPIEKLYALVNGKFSSPLIFSSDSFERNLWLYSIAKGEIDLEPFEIFYSNLNEDKTGEYDKNVKIIKNDWGKNINSSVILPATSEEFKLFQKLPFSSTIPELSITYSNSNHTLPKVINNLSIKFYKEKELNGSDILNIINDTLEFFQKK
ncbi:hypothetical protein DICPUDRAFT_81173 [Dictyostelium purpureum]|uniref:Uncharacterized protein n=1 Tax=Dictyostelium purpureum TaxID=5786 RepID=F0ZSQ1_DICPU|nr:uncharacterized protein DICPUDRAFT_81173 [Dictyostelium purpureum]EGC33028.1 hypothetical protein DICPUDRAFT_81173 [Dictyostelium purpureum]|eukprot:XP_003290455.1 hypothetical protein DICPUDRAFT_81173 [Dictyostelium purpureum]